MISELHTASSLLRHAVDRYIAACLTISNHHKPGDTLKDPVNSVIVAAELQAITSFELKINQTKRVLGKLQNSFQDLTPINSLPPEILSHIFDLTRTPGECALQDPHGTQRISSRSPDSIQQVCSYWRIVALDTCSLWTHIDLAPHHRFARRFVDHGRLSATRAGQLPLSIHLNMSGPLKSFGHNGDLLELCTLVASRAASIRLIFDEDSAFATTTMVNLLLTNATPGKLAHFTLQDHGPDDYQTFLLGNNTRQLLDLPLIGWQMDISHDQLEEVFRSIKFLRLNRAYPHWISSAYHGLVKLHLTNSSGVCLKISQLAGILKASPLLRFFHFGTEVQEDTMPEPVRLTNLEVLHLEFDRNQHDAILRLFLPGSKSLQLSIIAHHLDVPNFATGECRRFFERSNVTRLHVGAEDWYQLDFLSLLELVPNVQTLSLDGAQIFTEYWMSPHSATTFTTMSSLEELYISSCRIIPEVFHQFSKIVVNAKILINAEACLVEIEEDGEDFSEESMEELRAMHPNVAFVDAVSLLAEDWDE